MVMHRQDRQPYGPLGVDAVLVGEDESAVAWSVSTGPAGRPATSLDLDGDGEEELFFTDSLLARGHSYEVDLDADGDLDVEVMGAGRWECDAACTAYGDLLRTSRLHARTAALEEARCLDWCSTEAGAAGVCVEGQRWLAAVGVVNGAGIAQGRVQALCDGRTVADTGWVVGAAAPGRVVVTPKAAGWAGATSCRMRFEGPGSFSGACMDP